MNWDEINLKRVKAGKSWDQLAKTVDISASGLYNAVNRKTLTIKNFESLCIALDCEPCSFFECGEKASNIVNEAGAHYYSKKFKAVLLRFNYSNDYSLYSWKHTGNKNACLAGIPVKEIQLQNRHHSLDETDKYLRGLVLGDAKNIRNLFPEI